MSPTIERRWRTASTMLPVPASPLERIRAAPSEMRRRASPRLVAPQTKGVGKAHLSTWWAWPPTGSYPAETGVPTGAKLTHVRPGVSFTAWPAESVNFVGDEAESLDQWPFVIRPPERIQASPVPVTVDSTTLVPDWST